MHLVLLRSRLQDGMRHARGFLWVGAGGGRQCDVGLTPEEGGSGGRGFGEKNLGLQHGSKRGSARPTGSPPASYTFGGAPGLAGMSLPQSPHCASSLVGAVSQLHTPQQEI